ncbi:MULTISPECIES: hypothetical protein [Methylotenera]|uniref:hypothetical protein n=1 Tax=Methylotenera TaxID=359407 RepID=UPI000362ADBD|nr:MULTISPECIES: hypothetical protein [Methylotenera]
MKRELVKSVLLGGLVLTSLALGSFKANASGFNQNAANDGKVMSEIKFQDILQHTSPNQLASNFGKPDEIVMMKNSAGDIAGVIWVYHDAVLKTHGMMDARFVLVDGHMKYVTLTDAV